MSLSRAEARPSHTAFAPGARVEIRGEEWLVRKAEQTSTGDTAVHVTGLSELVRNKASIFLTDLDPEMRVLEPAETELTLDPSPGYRRSRLYLESLLRQSPPTDARLYRGHRGAMEPAECQLVPAAKALAQPRPRILIADGVGLGKTIEVGMLLSELIRRGRGRRILVVALKSVLEQFQEELWARFTIPLVRLDSVGLERVQRKIPANHNPFYYFDRAIISIDTLKKDEKYRRYLEACHWDAVVVDERQHVAVRSRGGAAQRSQRAKLAGLLARTSEALILTSATPHDGKKESFASLMNLLEPTAIADEQDYAAEDVAGLFVRRFKKDIKDQVRGSFRERTLPRARGCGRRRRRGLRAPAVSELPHHSAPARAPARRGRDAHRGPSGRRRHPLPHPAPEVLPFFARGPERDPRGPARSQAAAARPWRGARPCRPARRGAARADSDCSEEGIPQEEHQAHPAHRLARRDGRRPGGPGARRDLP